VVTPLLRAHTEMRASAMALAGVQMKEALEFQSCPVVKFEPPSVDTRHLN
jgi:hypothetical protein